MEQLDDAFEFARKHTQILRSRKNLLYTFGATKLPYLCFSVGGNHNIIIREGEVTAEKPNIAFPGRDLVFDGFTTADDEYDEEMGLAFLLARGVKIPAANYINTEQEWREESGNLEALIERELNRLEKNNDIRTGVIHTPEKVWRLGLLLYVGAQITRSAESNISEHFERLRLNGAR